MTDDKDGYVDAFYRIAELLDITPQPASPKEVFEKQMLPKLERLLSKEPRP